MSPIVEKERELSEYIEEWISARYEEWYYIYTAINRDRQTGIYRLKLGDQLLQLLYDIIGNIEEHFGTKEKQHIIPSKFSSISQLLHFLENFQKHINNHYYLIEQNFNGEDTDTIVHDINRMCNDIDEMVTRCLHVYLTDNTIPIPYQQVHDALRNKNVELFVKLIEGLIKNVPYNIHKKKLDEGYFHTIIHVITSVLGMSPISEAETADGRIDMMIEYPNCIYILEFKYSGDNKNRANEAIEQIKKKEYAKAYYIKGKTIYGVGMSFSQKRQNINISELETLYEPGILPYKLHLNKNHDE